MALAVVPPFRVGHDLSALDGRRSNVIGKRGGAKDVAERIIGRAPRLGDEVGRPEELLS